jgi:hypothetical protein
MCVSGKLRPVETISGRGMKENGGEDELKNGIFDIL